ncbi:MAG: biopolymer transporter ExbD [Bacteroidales bacterium]
MAQLDTGSAEKGKRGQKKQSIHVDFTAMVDMNMLLLTFFMLCTTMIKSQTLQISLPSNEKVDKTEQNKVKQSEAITIILDSEREPNTEDGQRGKVIGEFVYYYEGQPVIDDADKDGILDANNMNEIAFEASKGGEAQGIRAVLHDRNKQVIEKINLLKAEWREKKINDDEYQDRAKEIRNDSNLTRPIVIIKATPNASYETLITALDEMQINSISRYQIDRINGTDSLLMMDIKAKTQK